MTEARAGAGPVLRHRPIHYPPAQVPVDRSGYRVPAIVVSPWVAEGEVFNAEHRHTR